jgi:hypothetical protein
MEACELTTGLLIGLCTSASLYATFRVKGHLAALLPWLTLAIATSDPLALAVAAGHAVASYLLFVRAQGAMVREAFALADRAQPQVVPLVSWKSPIRLRVLHPTRPLPR